MNEQQNFWKNEYALDYIEKNKVHNQALGVKVWDKLLSNAQGINSILECGCNIGKNVSFLKESKIPCRPII